MRIIDENYRVELQRKIIEKNYREEVVEETERMIQMYEMVYELTVKE